MTTLAREFRETEKGLAGNDACSVAAHVDLLREACKGICVIGPQSNTDLEDAFASCARSVVERSEEVGTLARREDLARASQAFEELRSACVECHVKFRDGNSERGLFPARGNTITGEVTILTLDGKERADRSNVLVFLEGVPVDPSSLGPGRSYKILQEDTRFDPRVLPVLRGCTVEFPNDDFIYHNVFSLSETQPFDLGAYGPGKSKSIVFQRAGLVRVYCNIHPEMIATIVVLENPCFALTDRKGLFVISGVPDGTYALRTWHEYGGGDHCQNVSPSGSSVVQLVVPIREDKVTIEHKNKFGQPYRGAYR
jgi:hypothetical protein